MNSSRQDRWISGGLTLSALGLYLGFLSQAYVFEGLIRAMPIDAGRWGHLFPGNYLLYGPLGLIFHTVLSALGLQQPAVISLQIMDALIGALGVGLFYRLLRRLNGSTAESTAGALLLGVSLGYWLWSTDAEDYILSTVLLLTQFYYLIRSRSDKRIDAVLLGGLEGLAILGHIVNVIFMPVALFFFWKTQGRNWTRPMRRYLAAALIVAGGAYAAVIAWIRRPMSLQETLQWFEGSAGRGNAMTIGGAWTFAKFWEWLHMSLHIFGSFQPAYEHPAPFALLRYLLPLAWILLAGFAILLLIRWKAVYRADPAVAGGGLIWLGVYALMFTRWEPYTMVYRVSDLVPAWILLFLAYRSIPAYHKVAKSAAVIGLFALGLGNLSAEIYPRALTMNNPNLARMDFLKANTAEDDWITGDSRQDEIYIPYFAGRRPIVIQRYAGQWDLLEDQINQLLLHDQAVFVTSRVLHTGSWTEFFKRYHLELRARDDQGFELYRLRRGR
jgi:hypothetical protein